MANDRRRYKTGRALYELCAVYRAGDINVMVGAPLAMNEDYDALLESGTVLIVDFATGAVIAVAAKGLGAGARAFAKTGVGQKVTTG